MNVRTFALIFGIVFTLIGILGFVPGMVHPPAADHPPMQVDQGYGQLLGLFPVNLLHNVAHLGFGLWGLLAYRSVGGARLYFRGVAIGYGLLGVLGLVPGANTLFGLVPLFGNDVWLHLLLALGGVYFGFIHREPGADAR